MNCHRKYMYVSSYVAIAVCNLLDCTRTVRKTPPATLPSVEEPVLPAKASTEQVTINVRHVQTQV